MRPALLILLSMLAAVAPASASLDRSALCTIDVQLPGASGTARCAGWIGPVAVDPQESPASVTGACRPGHAAGELRLVLRRLISFDADPTVKFTARFSGSDVVTGGGRMGGVYVPLAGLAGCSSGTLHMELALGDAAAVLTQRRLGHAFGRRAPANAVRLRPRRL